jgi:hypothetical protein
VLFFEALKGELGKDIKAGQVRGAFTLKKKL